MELSKTPLDFYYKEYLYNIHTLINQHFMNWRFLLFDEYHYINGTNYDYKEFTIANKFLSNNVDKKEKLGEDILTRGVLFPFFAYSFKEKQEKTVRVGQGKHRIYSLLLYKKIHKIDINKEFLWLEFPQKIKFYIPPNTLYIYLWDTRKTVLLDKPITNIFQLYKIFDGLGAGLSNSLFEFKQFKPTPIFNNKQIFQEFINNPLDENNILFKLKEEKEAE